MEMELGKPKSVEIKMKGFKAEQNEVMAPMVEKDEENPSVTADELKAVRVVDEAMNRKSNVGLDSEIAREKMEQVKQLMVGGERVVAKTADGETRSARIVSTSDKGIVLAYRENGRTTVEAKTVDQFLAEQEQVTPAAEKAESDLDRGEKMIEGTMDKLEAVNKEIFDKVTKSKWLLAGRAGRFMTKALGVAGKAMDSAKGTDVSAFASDFKQHFTSDLWKVPAAMWGMPKEMFKSLSANDAFREEAAGESLMLAAESAEELEAKPFTEEEYEEPTSINSLKKAYREVRDGVANGALSKIVEGISQVIGRDTIRPVLKGNIEMVALIQDKIAGSVDINEEKMALEKADAEVEWEAMRLEAVVAQENDKLDAIVSAKRAKKLQEMINQNTSEASSDMASDIDAADQANIDLAREEILLSGEGRKDTDVKKETVVVEKRMEKMKKDLEKLIAQNGDAKKIQALQTRINMEMVDRASLKELAEKQRLKGLGKEYKTIKGLRQAIQELSQLEIAA